MLREDAFNKISVVGITEHTPQSPEHVLSMIQEGNQRRTMSPTEANAVSSRSHAVLQINVTQRPRTADTIMETTSASLNIIDLAGSERAAATNNNGARMKEGANINKSLLALGNCINALCQSGGRKGRHIPYRNSKLTRLLKFSLGGNCKTVMIVCVSPSSAHYDETHNTLKYANQAKNIRTKVSRNLMNVDRHVAQYVQAIHELKEEVLELKAKLAERGSFESAAEKRRKEELALEVKEAKMRMRMSTDNTKVLITQKAGVEALFAAARIRLDSLQIRMKDVDAQIASFGRRGASVPSDLQEAKQIIARLIARQEASLHDRTMQADLASLASGLQAHRAILMAAINNIKLDKTSEDAIRTLADAMLAEVEVCKRTIVHETFSKQLAVSAGTVADVSVACARSTLVSREASFSITEALADEDDRSIRPKLSELINQLDASASESVKTLYSSIGLKAEDGHYTLLRRATRPSVLHRSRTSVNPSTTLASRASVAQRRASLVPGGISLGGNMLLGARSPRNSSARRSMANARRSIFPRSSHSRSSTSSVNSASTLTAANGISNAGKSFRWADEAGEGSLEALREAAVAAPSKVIRTSLTRSSAAQDVTSSSQGNGGDGATSSSAEWEDDSREALDQVSFSGHPIAPRMPLLPSSGATNVDSEKKRRDTNAMFSTDFLRKKAVPETQHHEPSSDAMMDVDYTGCDSFDATDLSLVLGGPRTAGDLTVTHNKGTAPIELSKHSHAVHDNSTSSSSSDEVSHLSNAYSVASVRSSPYRKPRGSNENVPPAVNASGTIGPVRNVRGRGSGNSINTSPGEKASKASATGSAGVAKAATGDDASAPTFPRRVIRPSNAAATIAAAAAARAARPSSSLSMNQPFPLRKVPAGGIHNQHQQQS